MKFPIKYIIELGLIRKRNLCAKCYEKMDVENYNIQLCKKCRANELDKYAKRTVSTENNNRTNDVIKE